MTQPAPDARKRPRLGQHALETLAFMASPGMILITPAKHTARLVELGYASHDPSGHDTTSLSITPAGLHRLADELAAGRIKGAWEMAAKRREAGERHETRNR